MANENRVLDTRVELVTPENIALEYRVAGPFRRLPAYALDMMVRYGLIALVSFVLLIAGVRIAPGATQGLMLVVFFGFSWFYGGLFETFWNGQTPGKRIMKIRVLGVDGQSINAQQAILRNLLRTADFMPGMFQFGLLAAMLNDRFQRLGDLACGTMVVVEESQTQQGAMRVTEPDALALAAELPANLSVDPRLARLLSNYVLRRRALPWHRRIEIARHVAEPWRERLGLPASTSYDLLLCALYHRLFFSDQVTR